MKIGLQIPDFDWPGGPARAGATLVEMVEAADELGYHSVSLADHVFQVPQLGGAEKPLLECLTGYGFVAAHTERVQLIPTVIAAPFREPGMLAKMVTTLDVLSGGRMWLGIGAGYYDAEARGLGLPLPPVPERLEVLEETVQICLQMWQGDETPFTGKHFQLERPLNSPQSLARPHPPIMIGGSGEKVTLKLVARYADACNLYPMPDLPHKLDVLRAHCETEGRNFDAIEKICMFYFDPGEDGSKTSELVDRLRGLAALGIETVIGRVEGGHRITPLEIIARDVIPAVADL
jgi:F420-dependent oxidoreductase-like protein